MSTLFPQQEGISLKYKEPADSLPKTFFETVCAFLNRDGGLAFFGIADNVLVIEVKPGVVPLFKELRDRFSATIHLPEKGSAPEVNPEVAPKVASRLQKIPTYQAWPGRC